MNKKSLNKTPLASQALPLPDPPIPKAATITVEPPAVPPVPIEPTPVPPTTSTSTSEPASFAAKITRNEKLSADEIYDYFSYNYVSDIVDGFTGGSNISVQKNYVLFKILPQIADPDLTLLQLLAIITDAPESTTMGDFIQTKRDYIIPIALCLRNGANPNMYVNVDSSAGDGGNAATTTLNNMGKKIPVQGIHILAYIYQLMGNKLAIKNELLDTIIMLFIMAGAKPEMDVFSIRISDAGTGATSGTTGGSVINWLNSNKYNNILGLIPNANELKKNVDAASYKYLSIILDRAAVIVGVITEDDVTMGIRSYSNINPLLAKLREQTLIMMDYKLLTDAVNYINYEAFYALLMSKNLDIVPSYLMMNTLLLKVSEVKSLLVRRDLEKMILLAVSIGVELDTDQLALAPSALMMQINKQYSIPFWKKNCNGGNSTVSDKLRKLAVGLNLDPNGSKEELCAAISKLAALDPEVLKSGARKRQQALINAELGYISEFTSSAGGTGPNLTVINSDALPYDPLDYNDIDIVFYRDTSTGNTGNGSVSTMGAAASNSISNGSSSVWAIPSNYFNSVLKTKTNPFNSKVLSDSLLLKIQYKIALLKILNIYADTLGIYDSYIPITFSLAIDSLDKKDVISEKSSSEEVKKFIVIAGYNNKDPVFIRNLDKYQMTLGLKNISYGTINLDKLSDSHALVSVARIVNYVYSTSGAEAVRPFFANL